MVAKGGGERVFWSAAPFALRNLGVPDRPPVPVRSIRLPRPAPGLAVEEQPGGEDTRREGMDRAVRERRRFYEHVVLFAAGQTVLFFGASWPATLLSGELPPEALWTGGMPEGASLPMLASRLWCIVLIVDGIWSFSYALFSGKKGEG